MNYERNARARDLGYFRPPVFYDEEIRTCFKCGREIEPGEGNDEDSPEAYCWDCYLKKLKPTFTFENALSYGEKEKVTIELNGAIAYLLGVNNIERILTDYLYENCYEDTDVQEYAHEIGLNEWEGLYT